MEDEYSKTAVDISNKLHASRSGALTKCYLFTAIFAANNRVRQGEF